MSETHDEAERLRIGDEAANDEATRADTPEVPGAVSFLARTKTVGTYPAAAQRFYALEPLEVFGAEVEGGTGATTGTGQTLYGLNVGTAVPPSGTPVECTYVPYRITFQYD